MNIELLKKKLIETKIKKEFYSLNGGLPTETFCLNQIEDVWEVYYSERGIKSQLKIFNNESEACSNFYNFITSDSVVMENLDF